MARALIIDNFAGGGGASEGIQQAAFLHGPDVAINHDPVAISLHEANHPHTKHYVSDVFEVDPREVAQGRPIALAWFSPDCKHFSKAKGGKPVEKKIRALAWVVMRWAALPRPMKPAIIALENVEEFQDWGPLTSDGLPCAARKGQTFNLFVHRLRQAGYVVEWRELRACDYGAPTIRKRLFMIARSDGQPVRWPAPTHGDPKSLEVASGQLLPFRTAAECIDWSVPCPSIFTRERPLAEKTMARIARGVKRFVLDAAEPFIVTLTHHGGDRSESIAEPMKTITGANRGEKALIQPMIVGPFIAGVGGRMGQSPERTADGPFQTLTAKADSVVVAPFFVPRHGEHETQQPRCRSVEEPMPTVDPSATGASLVAAYMAQHNEGMVGHHLTDPVSTLTAKGSHQQLTAAFLTKFYGSCKDGVDVRQPFPTITADGKHVAEVRAFLMKYYGTGGQLQGVGQPMHTLTAKARLGLVTVAGTDYQIVDIGMRMLQPRELFRAQGFPSTYIIDRTADGTPISKTDQIRLCGNSVCPQVARAILEANFVNQALGRKVA